MFLGFPGCSFPRPTSIVVLKSDRAYGFRPGLFLYSWPCCRCPSSYTGRLRGRWQRTPSIPGLAPFDLDTPADDFKLPITKASGTCCLSVSLIDGRTEVEASWSEVRAKAGQLNQVCVASPSELSRMKGDPIHTGKGLKSLFCCCMEF